MKQILLSIILLFSIGSASADLSFGELSGDSFQIMELNSVNPPAGNFGMPLSSIPGVNRFTLQQNVISIAGNIPSNNASWFVRHFIDWEVLPVIELIRNETEFSVLLWDGNTASLGTGPYTGDAQGSISCHYLTYRSDLVAYCPDIDNYVVL